MNTSLTLTLTNLEGSLSLMRRVENIHPRYAELIHDEVFRWSGELQRAAMRGDFAEEPSGVTLTFQLKKEETP